MTTSSIRVLVVDDYEPFRRFVCSTLGRRPKLQIIGEASDGSEAVQKAEGLYPDLILLDVGLPKLDGIEVARGIRKLCPESKILFVSQESSADVVQEALGTGAGGYVVKTDVGSELLTAVDVVLRGEQFVGSRFAGHKFTGVSHTGAFQSLPNNSALAPLQQNIEIARRHEAGLYSDDRGFLSDVTRFIGTALRAGNAGIVVATESHRDSLLSWLQAQRLDIGAAIEQGRYIALDAADALPTFMLNGMPDRGRFLKVLGNLISMAAKAVGGQQARAAIFGEMCHLLWARGNAEGAIHVEKLGNELAKTYDLDILCGYSLGSVRGGMAPISFNESVRNTLPSFFGER